MRLSLARARERRDITVPIGIPSTVAISSYAVPRPPPAEVPRAARRAGARCSIISPTLYVRAALGAPESATPRLHPPQRRSIRLPVAARERQLIDEDVVHDREQPCAQIGTYLPKPSFVPRAQQRVLHEIVGAGWVARQHARVAAQAWNCGDQVRLRQSASGSRDKWRQSCGARNCYESRTKALARAYWSASLYGSCRRSNRPCNPRTPDYRASAGDAQPVMVRARQRYSPAG